MEKKRRNMLLYVTAASAVGASAAAGVACKDTPHAVGDVAQGPDEGYVGKQAVPIRDAAPAAESTTSTTPDAATSAMTAASIAPAADAAAPKVVPQLKPKPPGKIAAPPDKP